MNWNELCDAGLELTTAAKKYLDKTSYDIFHIQDISLIRISLTAELRRVSLYNYQKLLKMLWDIEKELNIKNSREPTYREVRDEIRKIKLDGYKEFRRKLRNSI
jgi:hypothetical protein